MQRWWLALTLGLAFAASNPAARAEAVDQFGKAAVLDGSAGYTVVDFAASWCEPCWKTLPKLQALADEHPNLYFVVVDVDDEVTGRDRLVSSLKLRVPVVWDEDHKLAERFAPEAMPSTYVLDPTGKVVYQHVGSSEKEWVRLAEFLATLGP